MMKKLYSLFILSIITLTGIAQDLKVGIVKFSDIASSKWQILDQEKKYLFGSDDYHRKDSISVVLEEQKNYFFYVSVYDIKQSEGTLYELTFGNETYTVDVAMGEGDHFIPFTTENISNDAKIVGGRNANINNFPWQVYIESIKGDWIYSCGGTIIAPTWILTAAHCVQDENNVDFIPNEMSVYYGSSSTNGRYASVKKIIRHARYSTFTLANDIALLELTNPIETSASAQPIGIITSEEKDMGFIDPGVMATVTGWGRTSPDNDHGSNTLQQVNLPIVSMSVARSVWVGGVPAGVLMAGYHNEGKDACSGDSGGPLVVNVDGEYRLAGIVSFGHATYNCNTYGGYTSVPYFENWIRTNTGITKWSPTNTSGDKKICVDSQVSTTYTTDIISGATNYEWNIHPLSAGTIVGDNTSATVTWTNGYTGDLFVKVRATMNGLKSDWTYYPVKIAPLTQITRHTTDSTILCANGNFSLNVTAQGDNLSYTWFQNGKRVGTNKTFSKTNSNESNSGIYTCQVSGTCGTETTGNMYVEIKPTTKIRYVTPDTTVNFGDNMTLTANATGINLKYQWYKNDKIIEGETSPKLNFTKLTANNIGNYNVIVRGTCGIATSKPSHLYVNNEEIDNSNFYNMWPTITSGIVNIAVNNDETYNFKVFNSIGKLLVEQTNVQYQCSVDLSNFPRGIYIIQIYNNSFKKSQKIIKDR